MMHTTLWLAFKEKFSEKAAEVESYKKVGSKTLSMKMTGGGPPVLWYYNGPNDWTLGTYIWRHKPTKGE